jgi:hypothetical protein
MGDEAAPIIFILFFCCCFSSIVALAIWGLGGTDGAFTLPFGIGDILANFHLDTTSRNWNPPQTTMGGAYNFREYKDFTAGSWADLGGALSLTNIDDCNSKCAQNSQCRGFTFNNSSCQLKNNVTVLDYSKGSSIWASDDIGATQFLKLPYQNIVVTDVAPVLRSNTGQFADAVSNCFPDSQACGGFSGSNGNWSLYPQILAVNSKVAGETYARAQKPPKFISEGNYRYITDPSSSWTMEAKFLRPAGYNDKSPNDMDHFNTWQVNWDASQDSSGPLRKLTGVANGAQGCANLCMSNSWCQSFVVGKGSEAGSCWLRHDVTLPPKPVQACSSQAFADTGCVCIGCHMITRYENYYTDSSTRDTYFKYQYPLNISCPYLCDQDPNCVLATFDGGTCKQYNSAPPVSDKQSDGSTTSMWKLDKFPG